MPIVTEIEKSKILAELTDNIDELSLFGLNGIAVVSRL
jgi:hypothetical protein